MDSTFYISLSGQLALQRRLDTIANNVANSSTAGFRAENVTFDSVISNASSAPVAYAGTPEGSFALNSGAITSTSNPLDVAVRGDAFLAVSTSAGTVYTRDGRMRLSTAGDLETISGQPFLDAGGAPIQINPGNGCERDREASRWRGCREFLISRNPCFRSNPDRLGVRHR